MKDNPQFSELACRGGQPAFPDGPPDWPSLNTGVQAALQQAARDGSWGKYDGPHGARLTEALAQLHGVAHVLLCSSGTIAVELALRGAGVTTADEVILAGYDFPGNFRAVEAIGARPVLVDLARDRWTIDADQLDEAWSPAVKALVVSHMHASLAPLRRIVELARQRNVCVVEDACQAPGATVDGRVAGSWGDIGVLSFGGSKLLTAGRGGALLTNNPTFHQRAKIFGERGNQAFPLSELQAAVLLPQLSQLSECNARRQAAANRLVAALAGGSCLRAAAGTADESSRDQRPAFYKLSWFYAPPTTSRVSREQFTAAARAEGIALDEGFRGFAGRSGQRCRRVGELPECRRAAAQTVLLHHPVLLSDDATLDRLAQTLLRLAAWAADARGADHT